MDIQSYSDNFTITDFDLDNNAIIGFQGQSLIKRVNIISGGIKVGLKALGFIDERIMMRSPDKQMNKRLESIQSLEISGSEIS